MIDRRRFLAALATTGACFHSPAGASRKPDVWQALRAGGNVILMRHARTVPGIGDPDGFVLEQCGTQRNLSAEGRRDAWAIGHVFRSRAVPVGDVLSSRWCRCIDTARLAFGKVTPAPMLDSVFLVDAETSARRVREALEYASAHKGDANLVFVTHDVNIRAMSGESVAQGEMVVTRPLKGALKVLARIAPPGRRVPVPS